MVRFDHRPKILVIGATGKTGKAVVAQLLKKGFPVREQISDNPGVIAFPPALYGMTLAIGLGISFLFSVSFLPRLVSLPIAAMALIGAGWLQYGHCSCYYLF